MDLLTHTATGLFLSRAGFGRLAPQTPWVMMLAANAPDIDIVAAAGGPLQYLNYHRQITHALPAAPVLALLPVLAARVAARGPVRWRALYAASLAGVLSHLLLDWTNIYGVRLLLPFSREWFHLDWTGVVDLWIWAVFLVCLAGPVLVRLVNAEIGARGKRHAVEGAGFALLALVFLLAYNGARAVSHARAVAILDTRLYDGAAALRVAALPSPVNPLRWRGLVETESAWSVHPVDLLTDFDPAQGRKFYKPAAAPALEAARRIPVFQDFLAFSQYPFWRVTPAGDPADGARVEAMDLRFGTPDDPAFVATALLDSRGRVSRAWFRLGPVRPR